MGGRLSGSQIAQLQNFFHGRNEVELAFLFGSQARGTAGPLSDVDIAVLIADNAAGEGPLSYRLVLMGKELVKAGLASQFPIEGWMIKNEPSGSSYGSPASGAAGTACSDFLASNNW